MTNDETLTEFLPLYERLLPQEKAAMETLVTMLGEDKAFSKAFAEQTEENGAPLDLACLRAFMDGWNKKGAENTPKRLWPLGDLDDLQSRMSCASDLVHAVYFAMLDDSFTAEAWQDALFGAQRYLDTLVKEMREITEALFEEARTNKKRR